MHQELNGIFIIDKSPNITSAKVVAEVKKMTGAKKAGHTGTLDPFATGLMICCINRATRLAGFFLHENKTYEGILALGKETDTLDATGKIVATCDDITFSDKIITNVFKQFVGAIEQQPPVFSALKHKGTPLYKLARKGKPIQKPARKVYISQLKVLEIDLPNVRFKVSCGSGTYIRALCADLGKTLGCGGHLKELRRLESCGFKISQAMTLGDLEKHVLSGNLSDKLISMNDALKDMPAYISDEALTGKIFHGRPITEEDFINRQLKENQTDRFINYIKIIDHDNNLLAVVNHKKSEKPYKYCCVFPPEIQ